MGVLLRKSKLKMKHLPYKSNSEIQLDGRELRAENFKKGLKKKGFVINVLKVTKTCFLFTY